jgi:SAM-dependent methyltransferase
VTAVADAGRSHADAAPAETSAHASDESRAHNVERPWYTYAARLLPASAGRWVDLGCGQGEFLGLARAHGAAGTGVDYWLPNAKSAGGVGRGGVVADLNHRLPFRDASLDGVTLIEVIEHIVRAEGLVDEIARVVRPGGWLIVTTPNVVHLTYRLRALTGHPPKQEGYHYRFFTRDLLRETLETRGFRRTATASFGKQALLSKLARLAGKGRKHKVRYVVPDALEGLLAQHFVWRLERTAAPTAART